jgi:hypothetical protein
MSKTYKDKRFDSHTPSREKYARKKENWKRKNWVVPEEEIVEESPLFSVEEEQKE